MKRVWRVVEEWGLAPGGTYRGSSAHVVLILECNHEAFRHVESVNKIPKRVHCHQCAAQGS